MIAKEKLKSKNQFKKLKELGFAMTSHQIIPNAQTRAKNVARMQEANLRLDALNLQLDHLISMVEAENRKNPVMLHRLRKYLNPAIVESIQNRD
jgi:hypothetical protein